MAWLNPMTMLGVGIGMLGGLITMFAIAGCSSNPGASIEPQVIDLAAFERGDQKIENEHVIIGEHTAVYQETLLHTQTHVFLRGEKVIQERDLGVVDGFYPVISNANAKTWGSVNDRFMILVWTRDNELLHAETPYQKVASVQGMVKPVTAPYLRDRIAEDYPAVDVNEVLIIHPGQRPMSFWSVLPFLIFGLLLLGSGGGLIWWGFQRGKKDVRGAAWRSANLPAKPPTKPKGPIGPIRQ